MKDYQKLFAVRENNLTAEEIAGAETLVLSPCFHSFRYLLLKKQLRIQTPPHRQQIRLS